MKLTVYLQQSNRKGKKFQVTLLYPNDKRITIHFGAFGYSDYTKHRDFDRMVRYTKRHAPREDWTQNGIHTAGFWSRWILWSKPSMQEAIAHTSRKFQLQILRRKPPV